MNNSAIVLTNENETITKRRNVPFADNTEVKSTQKGTSRA